MTRAKNSLHLLQYADSPSEFIQEIRAIQIHLDEKRKVPLRPCAPKTPVLSPNDLHVGGLVRHNKYGVGKIGKIEEIKKDELTVVFKAKELFDDPKELFDSRKEAFERAICDLNGYQSSKENLLKTFNLLCDAEFFGRQEIAKLCDINSTNAGKMIY